MVSELENWVQKVDPFNTSAAEANQEELSEVQMYKVL